MLPNLRLRAPICKPAALQPQLTMRQLFKLANAYICPYCIYVCVCMDLCAYALTHK